MSDFTELAADTVDGVRLQAVENRVVAMMAYGFGDKAISQHLGMKRQYVQAVISKLKRKCGRPSRLALARWYAAEVFDGWAV